MIPFDDVLQNLADLYLAQGIPVPWSWAETFAWLDGDEGRLHLLSMARDRGLPVLSGDRITVTEHVVVFWRS